MALKEKFQSPGQLVKEQLEAPHIEESTSPPNSPIVIIKKKSVKWRMLTDLTEVNKVLHPVGFLQSGITLAS